MKNATILLAVMAVLVWAGPANAGGILYETGFETEDGFSEGTSIDGIDGWVIERYDYITTAAGNISGTMSMYTDAIDPDFRPPNNPQASLYFTNTTDWVVSFEVKAKVASKDYGEMLFYLIAPNAVGNGRRLSIVYFNAWDYPGNGIICAFYPGYVVQPLKDGDGNDLTYSADTVYGIRMVSDGNARSTDIYIDSGSGYVLVGDDIGFLDAGEVMGPNQLFVNVYDVATTVDDLSLVGVVPGDANFDGVVDGSDLSLLLTGWGTGTTWGEGDFDDNDLVDGSDLSFLLTNWTYPPGSAGSPVPEPATIGLLAFGAVALVRRRRRA